MPTHTISALFTESAGHCPIVLFGAGGLGRKTLERLRRDDLEPIAFCDNNPSLWGGFVAGTPVISPAAAAAQYGGSAAFVVTIWASWADRMDDQIVSLRKAVVRSSSPSPSCFGNTRICCRTRKWIFPAMFTVKRTK